MAHPRSDRPHKLTEWDHRVLKSAVCKNRLRLQHLLPSSKLPLKLVSMAAHKLKIKIVSISWGNDIC